MVNGWIPSLSKLSSSYFPSSIRESSPPEEDEEDFLSSSLSEGGASIVSQLNSIVYDQLIKILRLQYLRLDPHLRAFYL
jgi:hypothetical protein